jgi:hypothetical protein
MSRRREVLRRSNGRVAANALLSVSWAVTARESINTYI